jgi:hypothetical protein
MPIDPNIALGVKPIQFESPINQMAKVYEMQNMQQTGQANQLAMQERQRAMAEDEAVRNYFAQQDRSSPDFAKGLYGISPKTGQAYEKFQAETGKEKTLAKNAELEQLTKIHGVLKTGATQVLANPTLANAIRVTQEVGRMTGSDVASDIAELTALGDNPEAIRRWAAGHALEADKLLPKSDRIDVGGSYQDRTIDPLTGLPTVVSTTQKTLAPGEAQRIALDKQRVGLERQRISEGNRKDVVASTLTDAAGNVTQYNKFGELIGTKPNVGKPSATFEKTKAAKQQLGLDLDLAIKELTEATKEGGLIETATGSGAGALRDIGAGFFGQTTAGAEALGALQPIYDKVLKMVPRFEGPQSDKDTISYNKAAGDLGNPNAPTGKKLAAAKTILRLMKDRKAEFLTRDLAEGGAVPNAGGDVDASNPLLN